MIKRMRTLLCALAAGLGSMAAGSAPALGQSFGNAVAVGDGEVLVGEPTYDMRPGAVYVFSRAADGSWERTRRLEPSDGTAGDRFGIRLALDGDVLLVSSTRADQGSGAVYEFRRGPDGWTEAGRIVTDDRSPADSLGSGLAVDGDWMMVGTVAQDSARGALYVFRRDGDGWTQHSKLVPSGLEPGDQFGLQVALDGDWAMVGAAEADGAGTVYIYRYDATTDRWSPRGPLEGVQLGPQALFGADIAIEGETALISAPGFFQGLGVVFDYTYLPEQEGWQITSLLWPFAAEQGGQFGTSVSLEGETAWIGAPGAQGQAGRSYVFTRDGDTGEWTAARTLAPPDGLEGGAFASTVAVAGDLAVSAALGADYGAGSAYVFARSGNEWVGQGAIEGEVLGFDAVTGEDVECADGTAAMFGCESVDLLAFLPLQGMGAGRGVRTNDVWGWTDPESGREIALVGMTDQLAFVDVSDPNEPIYLGRLPKTEEARGSVWRDMKVYRDHVFVVSDGAGQHGMQVFDLTRLRGVDGSEPQTFEADALYTEIASAHNIVINEETGFAYSVGSSGGGQTCGGGLHMIDVRDPKNPTFAGCFADASTGRARTGYSHDAQCIVYRGPDEEHAGREICLGSNETALSISDVTDKDNPVALSTASYPNVGYSHQGWITDDHRYFYMNDELDEVGGNVPSTRTLVWDVTDLDDPILVKEHFSENRASDHNLYVVGNTMYQSNYVSGLRVLDISDPENPVHVGHLDTVPYGEDVPAMSGSWSNYPFFESGIVIVTSGREGLFIARYTPRSIS